MSGKHKKITGSVSSVFGKVAALTDGRLGSRGISAIGATFLVMVIVLGSGLFLKSQALYHPPNNVSMEDPQKSQVYLTGTGYQVANYRSDDDTGDDMGDDVNAMLDDRDTSDSSTNNSSHSTSSSSSISSSTSSTTATRPWIRRTSPYTSRRYSTSTSSTTSVRKNPTVKTSVKNGKTVKKAEYTFWVTALDYRGLNLPTTSTGNAKITVTVNGETLESTGTSGTKKNYKAKLKAGKNTIKIKAVDYYGLKTSITKKVTYKKPASKTTPKKEPTPTPSPTPTPTPDPDPTPTPTPTPEPEPKEKFEVSTSISSPHLEGLKLKEDIEVEEGTSIKDALKNAGYKNDFEKGELTWIENSGIAGSITIPDTIIEMLPEATIEGQDPDKLENGNIYPASKWIVVVIRDGKEISADTLKKGDKLKLEFILSDDLS